MKKIVSLLLALLMLMLPLAACENEKQEDEESVAEKNVVRLAGMKGPTSIGLVGLLEEDEKETTKNDYEFSLHGAASEIVPKLTKGELDIAAVPANLASTLYNNTKGEIKLLAVNNLGVVYIVAKLAPRSKVESCTLNIEQLTRRYLHGTHLQYLRAV